MKPLFFILLLVSCTDDFNSCYSNNTMVKTYPTAQECEQALLPSIQKLILSGEQIFAQCTNVRADLYQHTVKITWSVTNRGNLLLKHQNTDDSLNTDYPTDIFTSSSFLSHKVPIEFLHKNN
ncbi:hypothetical protein [Bartonella sp. CB175]|uniref:hypothetical protein n=1 Tax=Bartonella sp. CB175 TaxID=3112256 RepID=UPI00300E23B2